MKTYEFVLIVEGADLQSVCSDAQVMAEINAELEMRRTAGGVMPTAG